MSELALVDPTKPYVEIPVDGVVYKAIYRLKDIALAEAALTRQGFDVTLLFSFSPTLANTIIMFAASVQYYHPKLGFEAAQELVTAENAVDIALALQRAWKRSALEPKPVEKGAADPSKPASSGAKRAGSGSGRSRRSNSGSQKKRSTS